MQYPFDPIHANIESQVFGLPTGIPDSDAVRQARQEVSSSEDFAALGQALSRQLRYREAIEAYTAGLNLEPENLSILRLRAGRYLTTLQPELAIRDFEVCLSLGAERLDCLYRMGLAHYYAGRYPTAMECFEACAPLCDDEVSIAVGVKKDSALTEQINNAIADLDSSAQKALMLEMVKAAPAEETEE